MNKTLSMKLMVLILLGLVLAQPAAAKNELWCVKVNNQSHETIVIDTAPSPGWNYTVDPGKAQILSGDHMVGCFPEPYYCTVGISGHRSISKVKPGAIIIYYGNNSYGVRQDARNTCEN